MKMPYRFAGFHILVDEMHSDEFTKNPFVWYSEKGRFLTSQVVFTTGKVEEIEENINPGCKS